MEICDTEHGSELGPALWYAGIFITAASGSKLAPSMNLLQLWESLRAIKAPLGHVTATGLFLWAVVRAISTSASRQDLMVMLSGTMAMEILEEGGGHLRHVQRTEGRGMQCCVTSAVAEKALKVVQRKARRGKPHLDSWTENHRLFCTMRRGLPSSGWSPWGLISEETTMS